MALKPPISQDIIVIGASGDLATRKLIPALYNLEAEGLLPTQGNIVGCALTDWSDDEFRINCKKAIEEHSRTGIDEDVWINFESRLFFLSVKNPDEMEKLHGVLSCEQRLIYFAVPETSLLSLVESLGKFNLTEGSSLIIEKPFGHDLESAKNLNESLHKIVPEQRIFRIDHYLGKETVQNLLVFRFGNSIFERVWNRDCIDHIEITVAETLGVERRGTFYEQTGAIRDIVQNHLFQLLALIAMEPPASLAPEAIRNEKVKVLSAVRQIDCAEVVRGQYVGGEIGGNKVRSYVEEEGVETDSDTETFAAMKIFIDSWRWEGVPFVLRTGKRMTARETTVVVFFKDAPLRLFAGAKFKSLNRNKLIIRIQPDEGIALDFVAKRPGASISTQTVHMNFTYQNSFKTSPSEAYERLLHDALMEDHTLFIREDEVLAGWQVLEEMLADPPALSLYRAGTWGPKEADELVSTRSWYTMADFI